MKPIKNQASSIAGLGELSTEAKLCFGAAGGCFVLGLVGYAINALSTTETTMSAFLVISAFYFMLGVISLVKGKASESSQGISNQARPSEEQLDDKMIESAA
jgi:hypothetical protein